MTQGLPLAKAAKSLLLLIPIFVFTFGCQIAPTRFDELNRGEWNAKLLVKDKAQQRSYILNVRFKSIFGEKLRMDFLTPIGGHLGSLLLVGNEAKYYLVKQKRYFEGKSNKFVLRPLLSADIDPRLVYHILFDRPINKKGWSCTKGNNGFVKECKSLKDEVKIKWSNRSFDNKTVYIEHEKAKIQMNFKTFSEHIEKEAESFQLKAPKGFKRFRIK